MSAFDDLDAEASRCVQCGLCVPKCPTYQQTGNEADSPRGRIAIMRGVWSGRIELTEKAQAHLSTCLTCRACEAACPSKVRYGRLIDAIQPALHQSQPAPLQALKWLAQKPSLLRMAVGVAKYLPGLGDELPSSGRSFNRFGRHPASVSERGEVALFTGCVGSAIDGETLVATIAVLNAQGYSVNVPQQQTCCGALHLHNGEPAASERLLQRNREVLAGLNMPILFVASGCGVQLSEGLPDLPVEEAGAFIARNWSDTVSLRPLAARVRVHEPCSQRNVLGTQASVYALLRRIPGAEVESLPGNDRCCGAAGSYHMQHPEMAQALRSGKIADLQSGGQSADWLVSSNIGCAMWLAQGLQDVPVRVVHPLVLLAGQLN